MADFMIRPDGIVYGPTANGKTYVSLYYHRRDDRSGRKSCWHPDVLPPAEYAIFEQSDVGGWTDAAGHWGFGARGRLELGTRGERLAKFPRTTNSTDNWHGYPVSPRDGDDAPSDDLVNRWIDSDQIEKAIGRRIQRQKI
jgi:hypothetical protein